MLDDFYQWLAKETPARADEIAARLAVFHRMLPKSYAGWPKGAAEVSDAMRQLEIRGLVERDGSDWRLVRGRKPMKQERTLFA